MQEQEPMRAVLAHLREEAPLTQAQLAERLSFTPSRLSRLESGDTELTVELAAQIASAIGTEHARAYAEYLRQEWHATERPSFHHTSRAHLWKADVALRRLQQILANPNATNAFMTQLQAVKEALEDTTSQLLSTEHPVILIGPPEVGKTTVICALAGLRRPALEGSLDDQMALQTGGGRVTISEVHVRNGSEYTITVDPYSIDDVQQFVSEFCDDRIRALKPTDQRPQPGEGISAEVDRAIRNMSGLTIKPTRTPLGQTQRLDQAQELAKAFPHKEDLLAQVLTRMALHHRNKTSITLPRDTTVTGLDWIAKTAAEINFGKHPDFSLPRRVEITVPERLLGSDNYDVRLIDTRGVDEPNVPRRDLQAYLDDPRSVIVFCSKFGDAPNGATLAVIERASDSGLKDAMFRRALLLILPRDRDDRTVRDDSTGDWVATADDGREIKRGHIHTTLLHHGCQELPTHFLNAQVPQDAAALTLTILDKIQDIRRHQEHEIDLLVSTIDQLLVNQETEATRAVFNAATRAITRWCTRYTPLPRPNTTTNAALLTKMRAVRYASSLRASVNRRGNWDNFDYWHALGFGTRTETVARTSPQLTEFHTLITTALDDPEFALAHDFLRFLQTTIDKEMAAFYESAEALGEHAFKAPLGEDLSYWSRCKDRWGGGTGYTRDITNWTNEWFTDQTRQDREAFIEQEVNRRWNNFLTRLNGLLAEGPTEANTHNQNGARAAGPANAS